jgi:signal transduction histidine kinase
MMSPEPPPDPARPHDATRDRLGWQLATESIVVRIRWFGILTGYVLVQTRTGLHDPYAVRAFLALGAGYAALDTAFHRWGEVFLSRWPLFVSSMEGLFIALLCYHDTGLDSPFRWYYLLSALCVAIRYRPSIAWATLGLHGLCLLGLARALPPERAAADLSGLPLTFGVLAWATWASSELAGILKATGRRLEAANVALERHGAELERRVAERTAALRASQARLLHQEKMAAFGLLSAGIAHEVGNPLAALSSLVQMLRRRDPDPYTDAKLDLAERQLARIQRTIRELVDFSRPASPDRQRFRPLDAAEEALGIAKYYHRTKARQIANAVPADLPALHAVRDHLVQVLLNLVLNAIDATGKGGRITLSARLDGPSLALEVADDGRGIAEADRDRVFQPYFTTKPQGTGLGLFVSRQIVAEMGGTLTFRSEPGAGTVFTVRLPAPEPSPAPPSPRDRVAAGRPGEGPAGPPPHRPPSPSPAAAGEVVA